MIHFKTRGKVDNKLANLVLNGALTIGKTYLDRMTEEHKKRHEYLLYNFIDIACKHFKQDDNTPFFKGYTVEQSIDGSSHVGNKRLLPFIEGFNIYKGGVKDSHWDTVIRQTQEQFFKELYKGEIK